jgi:3-oxocholest-4-en-26-oyl-CoA dehydrogenase alpha subunit
MQFYLSPETEAWRDELRAFLKQEIPAGFEGDDDFFDNEEQMAFAREFTKKLGAKRWFAPAWDEKYGGMGKTPIEQMVLNEELAYHRAPSGGRLFTIGITGPTVMVHGTEEQKQKYLPPMASGETWYCQGFSEPESGSDLASMQTRAVRDGDDYVINGQKIWTSGGHIAKHMILLARTDPDAPKHRGITYFTVDMKSPGVTVRPLVNLAGTHEFNEVFFEDVRVPRENIIGEENRGWYLAQTTLSFERSNIGGAIGARQTVEDLVTFAREHTGDGTSSLSHNTAIRHQLVERFVEAGVANQMSAKIISIQAKEGVAPGHEASVAKLYGTELNQRIYKTGMNLIGLYGQLDGKSDGPAAPMSGRIKYMYLRAVANTIEGGTSEIQRNIIATRGLGLPRA